MKFEIKSLTLLKILKKMIKITFSSKNLECERYSYFLLKVEKDNIFLTTTNDNLSMKYKLSKDEEFLRIFEIGAVLINSKIIYDIFSKLENEWILFELKINNLIISNLNKNTDNDFIFKLSTMAIETFSEIKFEKNKNNKITFKKKLLQNINEQIVFAINSNNNKPPLSGINFKFTKDELIITGTDGYCLAQKTILYEKNKEFENKEFNIPVYLLNEIDKITNELNSNINFYFENNNNLILEIENFLFKIRMIEGVYPNTTKIIKKIKGKEKNIIEINSVKDFIKIIELSIILSKRETAPMIEFLIDIYNSDFKINCLTNNNSIGEGINNFNNFNILKNNIQKQEKNIKAVFNSKLIIYALKSFNKCKKVILNISWPQNYLIIESEEEVGLLQIVLPIGEK